MIWSYGVIPCQITQWITPYPLQIRSYLVYRVILGEKAEILIFSAIGPTVLALWHALFCDFDRNWPLPQMFKSPYLGNHLAKSLGFCVIWKIIVQAIRIWQYLWCNSNIKLHDFLTFLMTLNLTLWLQLDFDDFGMQMMSNMFSTSYEKIRGILFFNIF